MSQFPLEKIKLLRSELSAHPLYSTLSTIEELSIFMQHHVYSVFDFMSLVKYLQSKIAPAQTPWMPQSDANVRRFINDIVLEEESDIGLPLADGTQTFISHFELYILAMQEVDKESTHDVYKFIETLRENSIETTLESANIPLAAKRFMRKTFDFIASDKPHVVAAAFALGREHIIPQMFRSLLKEMHITPTQAETFHYYLERHIHLDEDFHGPMSLRMLELLCEDDATKIQEAHDAAVEAIEARIEFFDALLELIKELK